MWQINRIFQAIRAANNLMWLHSSVLSLVIAVYLQCVSLALAEMGEQLTHWSKNTNFSCEYWWIKIRFGRIQSPNCVIRHIAIRQHHLSWPKAQANWHSDGACLVKLWSLAPPYRCEGARRGANMSVYAHVNVCVWQRELQRATAEEQGCRQFNPFTEIKAELLAVLIWCERLASCRRCHWPGWKFSFGQR